MPKKCPRYTQEMLNIGSNYAQDLRKAPQSKWSSLDRPTVKNLSVQTEHQGHRPPWLGVRSMLIPGVLRTPSILAGNQSTKVNRALGPARSSSIVNPCSILDRKELCRQIQVNQHHHFILHHEHHFPWLGISYAITTGVLRIPSDLAGNQLHQG